MTESQQCHLPAGSWNSALVRADSDAASLFAPRRAYLLVHPVDMETNSYNYADISLADEL